MIMKKLFLFILIFLILSPLHSQNVKFEWDFKLNRTFTIDKYTKQTVIKNGTRVRHHMIKDYVVLIPVEKKGDYSYLKGRYYSYKKDLSKKSVFQLDSTYDLDFLMSRRGRYKVPDDKIMPSVRDIPFFPKVMISPGDLWVDKGIEILEFKPPLTLNFNVNYQFVGFEKKFNKKLAKIVFSYIWNHVKEHRNPTIPFKFIGSSFSTLWYDTDIQLPVYTENLYDLGMIYKNGNVIQYKGELTGFYNLKRTTQERKSVKNEIYKKLKEADSRLHVRKKDDNVIIDIDDIYFKFDKDQLTDIAKNKLCNIGKVLAKYKNCRILSRGHTDNIGTQKYNQDLSERRALSVIKFLKEKEYIDPDQSSYRGIGEGEPVANNSTKEGRRKNRRVEIIITPE